MLKRPSEYNDATFLSKKLWSRGEARLWTITLFIGTSVLYASRVALPICAAAMAKEYGWDKTDSGTILSCFFWGYATTQFFAGDLADRYGGETILPYSSLAWIVLTIFTPQLFDFAYWTGFPIPFLVIARVVTGVGQAFHVPSMASMVSRHLTSADKGRVFGLCLAGQHIGVVVAGAIGSLLLEWLGWRVLFQFVGGISLIWHWWFQHCLTSAYHRSSGHSDSDEEQLIRKPLSLDLAKTGATGIQITTTAVPWGTLLRHPAWWAAAFAQFAGGNAYFTMFNWLPSYFHETFPSAKGVVYNVVPTLSIVVTSMMAPFLATKLLGHGHSMTVTRRVMEGVSLIGVAVCLFCVPSIDSFPAALIVFTLAMACRGLHHGGVSVNPHDFAPQHTGSVFGIFNAFGAITGFIGVYVAGHILAATDNNWGYVFIVTAVQCVLGAAVYGSFGTGSRII